MEAPEIPIVTERLVLRPWEDDDVDAMTQAITASVEHLRPWMPWIAHEPLDRAGRLEVIQRFRSEWESGASFTLAMFRDGAVVGGTGLHPRVGPGGLEIGYWVHVDHIGQGMATEAASALTAVALAMGGVDRVEIHHDVANPASGRVPAKLGYTMAEERAVPPSAPGETGRQLIWVRRSRPASA
jgi:ribosomal-protein-serine acetyltransferase